VLGLHGILAILLGGATALNKGSKSRTRGIGAIFAVIGLIIVFVKINSLPDQNSIAPEQFAYFNPMFIVLMTPVVVAYFRFLNRKGKEPSSPAKIGIGMLLTALSFTIMMIASLGLPGVYTLGEGFSSAVTVSPFWLISTYFVVTIGELHLSPMGLSFVSKTAPPRMKGLMMGFWFGATAVGNYLSGFVGRFYQNWELWQFFLLLVVTSLIAAMFVRIFLNKLKRATR
jgi:POT family proton-dependent oligopeptide transporter